MDTEKDCMVLDARTAEEYHSGHIRSAKLIPVDKIAECAASELPDKGQKVLITARVDTGQAMRPQSWFQWIILM